MRHAMRQNIDIPRPQTSSGSLILVQLPISSLARLSEYSLYQVYQTEEGSEQRQQCEPGSRRASMAQAAATVSCWD
jgi:hypothetical protein